MFYLVFHWLDSKYERHPGYNHTALHCTRWHGTDGKRHKQRQRQRQKQRDRDDGETLFAPPRRRNFLTLSAEIPPLRPGDPEKTGMIQVDSSVVTLAPVTNTPSSSSCRAQHPKASSPASSSPVRSADGLDRFDDPICIRTAQSLLLQIPDGPVRLWGLVKTPPGRARHLASTANLYSYYRHRNKQGEVHCRPPSLSPFTVSAAAARDLPFTAEVHVSSLSLIA